MCGQDVTEMTGIDRCYVGLEAIIPNWQVFTIITLMCDNKKRAERGEWKGKEGLLKSNRNNIVGTDI